MPRRPKDSPPSDPRQIIDDQARQIEQLREDPLRSEIERNRLRRENERLKEELGRKAHRSPPARVDVIHEAPLPGQCPDCGGTVQRLRRR